ncbi:MAG: hypothetical protein RL325_504, partial [Planctomycetota bacterium]
MTERPLTKNVVFLAALAASGAAARIDAQQFVDQTATRFPVQAEYTNQCTLV